MKPEVEQQLTSSAGLDKTKLDHEEPPKANKQVDTGPAASVALVSSLLQLWLWL